MSEDKITNQQTSLHDGFEHEDLRPKGPFYFMAGLVVLGLVIYLVAFGIYRFLDNYQAVHQPAVSPMVTPEADTRIMTHEETQTFPQPRLEENERTQLRSFIEDQDQKLATYDWVDKDKGIVRIPIDRAIDLIAKRGLPVHSEGASSAPSSGAKGSGAKSSAAQTSAPVKKQPPKARATKAAASGN